MVFVLRGFFLLFLPPFCFLYRLAFLGGNYFEVMLLTIFLSFLLLSPLRTILVPLGILIVRVCRRFSFYAFLAFTVTLWIPYGRVGYEKFRKNGITTSIIRSRCAPVTGPNQGFYDKV